MTRSVLVAAALVVPGRPGHGEGATPPPSFRVAGRTGEHSVAGVVRVLPAGAADGFVHVVLGRLGSDPISCRYATFERASVESGRARVAMSGVCAGKSGAGSGERRVRHWMTLVDEGRPGAGHDGLAIEEVDTGSVVIPAATLELGDVEVLGGPAVSRP